MACPTVGMTRCVTTRRVVSSVVPERYRDPTALRVMCTTRTGERVYQIVKSRIGASRGTPSTHSQKDVKVGVGLNSKMCEVYDIFVLINAPCP